jgi:hypothetical protein
METDMSWNLIRKVQSGNAILSKKKLILTRASEFSISAAAPAGIQSNLQNAVTMLPALIFPSVKDFLTAESKGGTTTYGQNTFDLMTFRDYNVTTIVDDSGNTKELRCNERYYVPSEITWMLKCLGFGRIDIFGAKQGAFSRSDKLTPEDFEMLVVAEI